MRYTMVLFTDPNDPQKFKILGTKENGSFKWIPGREKEFTPKERERIEALKSFENWQGRVLCKVGGPGNARFRFTH